MPILIISRHYIAIIVKVLVYDLMILVEKKAEGEYF